MDCSFKLIQLLLSYEIKQLSEVRDKIETIQKDITNFPPSEKFDKLQSNMNKNLYQMEETIIRIKRYI